MSSRAGNEFVGRRDGSTVTWTVLGLLIERPSYAYELARRFERRFSGVLHARPPRIYVALDRLEADSLIEPDGLPEGTVRQPKHHYRATAAGRRAYSAWLATQVGEDPQRVQLLARLLSIGGHDLATVLDVVEQHERACTDELAATKVPPRRSDGPPSERAHRLIERALAEEQRLRLQARLAWIAYVRHEIQAFIEHEHGPR